MKSKFTKVPGYSSFDTNLYKYTDSLTLADHTDVTAELFANRGLAEYYELFCTFHKNGPTNVYHGNEHAFMTALNCFEGALYSKCTTSEIKSLLVAGLYHDARHSQGKYSDKYNVELAKSCLMACHAQVPVHHQLKEKELRAAIQAISNTQYPYLVKNVSATECRVLRDADMMATYCADKAKRLGLFMGLLGEINTGRDHRYDESKPLSIPEFCEQQTVFASTMAWNTQWAKMKSSRLNWPLLSRQLIHDLHTEATR